MSQPSGEFSLDQIAAAYRAQKKAAGAGTERRPFKFLDAYGRADRALFFGRDAELDEIERRFQDASHLVIYAESGAGKTSLIECGLQNRLRPEDVAFVSVRCHTEPERAVRDAVSSALTSRTVDLRDIDAVAIDLPDYLRQVAARIKKTLVLFFDQFEELFLLHPREVYVPFGRVLGRLIEPPVHAENLDADQDAHPLNVKVVIAVRQEYLAHITELEFAAGDSGVRRFESHYWNRFWLRRMPAETAQEAMTSACRACDVSVQSGLFARILSDLAAYGQGVELPYLQVVSDRVYQQAKLGHAGDGPLELRLEHYQVLGNLGDILGSFLEEQIQKLSEDEECRRVLESVNRVRTTMMLSKKRPLPLPGQDAVELRLAELCRKLLKALITTEGTRRARSATELVRDVRQFQLVIDEARLQVLLQAFVKARVLHQLEKSGLYELRHDLLARKVHSWMTGMEKELLQVREDLQARLRAFQQRGALLDASFLEYLGLYLSRLHPNEEETRFIEASRKYLENETRKRRNWAIAVVSAVLVTLAALGVWALSQRQEALRLESANAEAHRQRLESYGEKARVEMLAGREPEAAAYLSYILENPVRKNARRNGMADSSSPLLAYLAPQALRSISAQQFGLKGHGGRIASLAAHPRLPLVVSGSDDRTAKLWDVARGVLLQSFDGHRGAVNSVSLSADGTRVATCDRTCVRVWDAASGRQLFQVGDHQSFYAVTFTASGLVTAGDGGVIFWSIADGGKIGALPLDRNAGPRWIAAGGDELLLVACDDGHARLYGKDRKLMEDLDHEEPQQLQFAALSPDGRRAVTVGLQYVKVWDLTDGRPQPRKFDYELCKLSKMAKIRSAAFSSDARHLATDGEQNAVCVWDTETGALVESLEGHAADVFAVAFASDQKTLLSGGNDALLRGWDLSLARQRILAHGGAVDAATFSPDGQYVVSAGQDNTAKLWDARTGQLLKTLPHSAWVGGVRFSPDGRLLATAARTEISLWQVPEGRLIRTLDPPSEPPLAGERVIALDFDAAGGRLVAGSTVGRSGGSLLVWDVNSGKCLRASSNGSSGRTECALFDSAGRVLALRNSGALVWDQARKEPSPLGSKKTTGAVFSPDGLRAAVVGEDFVVRLFDLSGNAARQMWSASAHKKAVRALAFSPDREAAESLLASGSADRTIQLWKANSGELIAVLPENPAEVVALALAPSARGLLLGATADGAVRFWETRKGRLLQQFPSAHHDLIRVVAFDPQGERALTAGWDGVVRLWQIGPEPAKLPELAELLRKHGTYQLGDDGCLVRREAPSAPVGKAVLVEAGRANLLAQEWDAAAKRLAEACDKEVPDELLRFMLARALEPLEPQLRVLNNADGTGDFRCAYFSPDGRRLLLIPSARTDGLPVLDAQTGALLGRLPASGVKLAVLDPFGKYALTLPREGSCRLWDLATFSCLAELQGHADAVHDGVFSPDGRRVGTVSEDHTARIWDVPSGKPLVVLKHDGPVQRLSFSSDGGRLATAGEDNCARIWTADGQLLYTLKHEYSVENAVFSPDGSQLATHDREAYVWDTATGQLKYKVKRGRSPTCNQGVLFAQGGKSLVVNSTDSGIRLCESGDGARRFRFAHQTGASWMALHPDGRMLAVSGTDGVIRLVDLVTGQSQGDLIGHRTLRGAEGQADSLLHVQFSPDGSRLVSAGNDGPAIVWDLARLRPSEYVFVRLLDAQQTANGLRLLIDDRKKKDDPLLLKLTDPRAGKVLRAAVLEEPQTGPLTLSACPETTLPLNTLIRGGPLLQSRCLLSPSGDEVLFTNGNRLALLDLQLNRPVCELGDSDAGITSAVFSPDGSQFALAREDGTILLRRTANPEQTHLLNTGQPVRISALAFSADGQWLAVANGNGGARLWELASGTVRALYCGHGDEVASIHFSPGGQQLVTGSADGTVRLWDLRGNGLKVLKDDDDQKPNYKDAIFSLDERFVFTADAGGRVKAWSVSDGRAIALLWDARVPVRKLQLSSDGLLLLAVDTEGRARSLNVGLETRTPAEVRDFLSRRGGSAGAEAGKGARP